MEDLTQAVEVNEAVERLAKRVHDAWWTEKKRQGFHLPEECPEKSFFPYCNRCEEDMRSYEGLNEDRKELRRVMVRGFIGHLAEEGYFVVPSSPVDIPMPLFEDFCRFVVEDPTSNYESLEMALKDEVLHEIFNEMLMDWEIGNDDLKFIAWWTRQHLRIKTVEMK